MNDRIKELIASCGLYESSDEDVYRFIILIVQECMLVVEESEGCFQYFPHVLDNIEKHFGLTDE